MSNLPRWASAAAAVIVGATVTLGGAGVASAETTTPATGTQVYIDSWANGAKVINSKETDEGSHKWGTEVSARRLGLKVAGAAQPVLAYCIDYRHDINSQDYVEGPWAPDSNNTPTVAELGSVQWVLTHSYPNLTPDAVIAAAHATKPAGVSDELLIKLVYAGTQSAIWTLTDGDLFALRDNNQGVNTAPNGAEDQYGLIVAISDYLVKAGKNPAAEPQPKLVISPATLTGPTGKKIGPYTVESGGGLAELTAEGGKLVDADGKAVTELPNGGKFYVLSDNVGTVKIAAHGSGSVPIGRVFITTTKSNVNQKLILAGVAGTKLDAAATATVTPPPPSLPVTGVNLTGAIVAGGLLIAGGAALVLVVRRRRVRFTV